MSRDDTPISDQLKKVVDDLQLESKVRDAAVAAEQAVLRGMEATSAYLREHRDGIEGFLDRASSAVDGPTGGRFSEQVGQVRHQLSAGLASLADRQWRPLDAPPALPEAVEGPDIPDVSLDESDQPDQPDQPDTSGWSGSTDQV
jgi:hypothetical protein